MKNSLWLKASGEGLAMKRREFMALVGGAIPRRISATGHIVSRPALAECAVVLSIVDSYFSRRTGAPLRLISSPNCHLQRLPLHSRDRPDSLFQANRHRKLTLENVEASTPDGEMALIKRYTFRVGANETSLSVQTLGQAGSA
jgi:hypothetical protein